MAAFPAGFKGKFLAWGEKWYGSSVMSFPQVLSLMAPLLLDQLFIRILSVLNTSMVSSYGPEAVAAVSMVDSLNIFMVNFFISVATGCTVVVAQYCGRGQRAKASEVTAQSVSLSVALALIIAVFLYIFANNVIHFMLGAADQLMQDHARVFLRASAISYIFYAIIQTISGAMRGAGNAKMSVFFTTAHNIINVLGNILFLNVFHLGVMGLSLSLVISRALVAVPCLLYMIKGNPSFAAKASDYFVPDMGIQRSICLIAIPTSLEQVFFHAGRILTQMFIVPFGTMSVAANAVALPFSSIVQLFGSMFQAALVTMAGQCIGAGYVEEARTYIKRITWASVAGCLFMSIVFAPILPWFLSIYNLPPEAYQKALFTCIMILIGTPLTWSFSFVIPSGLRAAGDATFNSVVSLVFMWVIRVALAYYFSTVIKMGGYGVWLAMFIEWGVRSIVFYLRLMGEKWYTHKVI